MAESPLLSLAAAKKSVGLPAAAGGRDQDVRDQIAAITPIMEDIVGPVTSRDCDEWHDGGAETVVLFERPLLSVTTVTESSGTTRYTLTEQPLSGSTFNVYGYTVDLELGKITRRSSGSAMRFAGGRENVHVVYTAGRLTVPMNIVAAARRLFRHTWQQENNGLSREVGSPGETQTVSTPSGFLVPRVVVELCGSDARPMGSA